MTVGRISCSKQSYIQIFGIVCCFGRVLEVFSGRLFVFHDEFPLIFGVVIVRQLFVIDDDGVGLLIKDKLGVDCCCPL
jgi:hypothetical protein